MSLTITAAQLKEASLLFGGDEDDVEITFIRDKEGCLYVYCTEHPEEGSVCLSGDHPFSEPIPITVKKCDHKWVHDFTAVTWVRFKCSKCSETMTQDRD